MPLPARALRAQGKSPARPKGQLAPRTMRGQSTAHPIPHGSHGVGGFLNRFGSDIKKTALNAPGGFIELGNAVGSDVKGFYHNLYMGAGTPSGIHGSREKTGQTGKIVEALGRQTAEDFKHPLRHPGNTALDISALASGGAGIAARGALAGRALRLGEYGDAASAILKRPPQGPRYVRLPDRRQILAGSYSRNQITKLGQKMADKVREAHPDTRGLLSPKTQRERYGTAFRKQQQRITDLERSKASAIVRESDTARINRGPLDLRHGLTAAQQKAIQVVGEGVPINQRIKFHKAQRAELKGRNLKRTNIEIKLLTAAKEYVHSPGGDPRILAKFPNLQAITQHASNIAHTRTATLVKSGVLDLENTRIHQPGQILTGKADFANGKFRVPYTRERSGALTMRLGSGKTVGLGRKPSTVTHEFTGGILKTGGGRVDTTHLLAESYVEAQRYASALNARHFLLHNGQETAAGLKDPVAIRESWLKSKPYDPRVKEILKKQDQGITLNARERVRLEKAYNDHFQGMFDESLSPSGEKIPGVKWIDRAELGGLDMPNPLVGLESHKSARAVLHVFDSINNASRAAILYLKPAYAAPNILGNTALTLLQQGFAAPLNLWHGARLNHLLAPVDAAAVDELVGAGITAALKADRGFAAKSTQWAGSKWEKVVDQPFRRASFLYEAKREGFRTPEAIHELIHNKKNRDKLHQVVDRANRELIDYGNLSPVEREFIRRMIFFYPWVKGSTTFAARQLAEHPIVSAVQAQAGRRGAETQARELGPQPSWAEALVKTSGFGNIVRTINPSAASISQTPADILEALSGGGFHNLAENFTPAIQAVSTAFTGRDPLGRPVKGNRWLAAGKQLYQGLPAWTLYDRLTHDQKSKTYPMTKEQAFLQFLIGAAFAQRNTNKYKLNKSAYTQRHPHP